MSRSPELEAVSQFAHEQHAGQTRKTRSIVSGEFFGYAETHLEEVARKIRFILQRMSPHCPNEDLDPIKGEALALLHDLYEDCNVEQLPLGELVGRTRQSLLDCGLSSQKAEWVSEKIIPLTKDGSEKSKKKRNGDMFKAISKEPLLVKLVKFADQWHNSRTMKSLPLQKALRTYLKIRESWEVVFNREELFHLFEAGFLEDLHTMKRRTVLFDLLRQSMSNGTDLGELIAFPHPTNTGQMITAMELYNEEINLMNTGGRWVNPNVTLNGAAARLDRVCSRYMTPPPFLPRDAEDQIKLCYAQEKTVFVALMSAKGIPLHHLKQLVEMAAQVDLQVSKGKSNFMVKDHSLDFVHLILGALKMTTEEFLAIKTQAEWDELVGSAIVRAKTVA